MAEKVLMLALSPTMEEGTIAHWKKKEGDSIKNGDIICEVETDKATMDYESIQEGTLLKIIIGEGGVAKVEQPIAVIGKSGEDISALLAEINRSGAAGAPSSSPKDVPVSAASPSGLQAAAIAEAAATDANGRVKSSPLARVLAGKSGIDISELAGSGPGGRVVKRDIEAAARSGGGRVGAPAVSRPAARTMMLPSAAPLRSETVPLTQKRRVIAERLSQSMFSAPHYYLRLAVHADSLVAARAALNAKREKKISMNAFLIKFVAEALKRFPTVNASWQETAIQLFGSIDVGLAVAQPDGLITPVVRDCGSKGILQIDSELAGLIEKAQTNKLRPEEYGGATFTISNLGSFGIDEFTAVINPPGSAILAVGSIKKEPVVGPDDRVEVKTLMRLTLSCDHRVIDGAVGASFLRALADMIEEPVRILY